MTEQEAIEYLKLYFGLFEKTCEPMLNESMSLAIKALEEQDKQKENVQKCIEEIMYLYIEHWDTSQEFAYKKCLDIIKKVFEVEE